MFYDLFRLASQNRALHCYLLLLVWIFLLVAGLYQYLEPSQKPLSPGLLQNEFAQRFKLDAKTKRIFRMCNHPNEVLVDAEGSVNVSQWNLRGIILVMRHGDRGPLQYIRNISSINCGAPPNDLLGLYQNYLSNATFSGRAFFTQPGPFHGFPFLPTDSSCRLGLLTMQGIEQLLRTGQLLRSAYNSLLHRGNLSFTDVTVYSTRYRRTFQSALALLYAIFPNELFSKLTITESPSMSFCFSDCACPAAENFTRVMNEHSSQYLESHPAVQRLVRSAATIVFEQPDDAALLNPHSLCDAALAYVCHGATLPCINSLTCLKREHISGLFAYTEWENHQRWKNPYWRRACILRSYGLVKNIVSHLLKMVSSNGPKFVLYSGHDYTLQYLGSTLGISSDNVLNQYAARIIFEVYQNIKMVSSSGVKTFYFRLVVNGRDVTSEVKFCRRTLESSITSEYYGRKTVFCRVEEIVRFIHDNYFYVLNVTNFKDACFVKK